jgi:hypothetical protein
MNSWFAKNIQKKKKSYMEYTPKIPCNGMGQHRYPEIMLLEYTYYYYTALVLLRLESYTLGKDP